MLQGVDLSVKLPSSSQPVLESSDEEELLTRYQAKAASGDFGEAIARRSQPRCNCIRYDHGRLGCQSRLQLPNSTMLNKTSKSENVTAG